MAFKLWTSGELLTAADVNTYLSQQVIIRCTSGTRPSSPSEGMHIYETDTKKTLRYTGSAWEAVASSRISYTPSLTATTTNPTLGTGSSRLGYYSYLPGNLIFYTFGILFGTSGSNAGSGQYLIDLPVAASAALGSSIQPAMGPAMLRDNSSSNITDGTCYIPASNLTSLSVLVSGASIVNSTTPWTWAAQDYLAGSITYPI